MELDRDEFININDIISIIRSNAKQITTESGSIEFKLKEISLEVRRHGLNELQLKSIEMGLSLMDIMGYELQLKLVFL